MVTKAVFAQVFRTSPGGTLALQLIRHSIVVFFENFGILLESSD